MQNARDSFYEMLRGRLAALNPERTVVIRGVTRPAVVVDDHETASVAGLPDCFHLHWGSAEILHEGELEGVAQACEIRYSTAGNAWNGGVDRGRTLGAMDGELLRTICAAPQNAPKVDYRPLANGGQPVLTGSRIWWSDVSFAPEESRADLVSRKASVRVMSFEKTGEL